MPKFNLKRRYISAFVCIALLNGLVSCSGGNSKGEEGTNDAEQEVISESPAKVIEIEEEVAALAEEDGDDEIEDSEAEFDYVGEVSEGLKVVKKDGFYGYVEEKGAVVIPLAFDDAQAFREGGGAVKKEGKWGFVDKNGELIIPHKFDKATSFFEGKAAFRKGAMWGYIDKEGNEVISPKYDFAFPYKNGKAKVQIGMDWMLINHEGQCVENCPN
ncbi:WG repeat-containing protein [Flammeovirgaceae bacterium SG7u.111]|nr:WG repeat-containing protein [Flammeovirgaceae bacterium SG7u.132]WPO35990.1 WG repeat-containing protein [Flammeovirgaceae bacterium SG7u.111]